MLHLLVSRRRLTFSASPILKSRTRRRINLLVSLLVILSMLTSLSPFAGLPGSFPGFGTNIARADDIDTPPPPDPDPVIVPPVIDPHLPNLVIRMGITPHTLAVGDVFTVTVAVNNDADDPATNLTVTLPLPIGAAPEPLTNVTGWEWPQATLAANSTVTNTAVMRLVSTPLGSGLVVRAQATASGLPIPIVQTVGAVVVQRLGPTIAPYLPVTGLDLRSLDGRAEVILPPLTSARVCTPPAKICVPYSYHDIQAVQFNYQPAPGQAAAPEIAGRRIGFPTMYISAVDVLAEPVYQFSQPVTISMSYTPEQLQALGISEDDLTFFWFDESQAPSGQWMALDTSVDPSTHTATTSSQSTGGFQLSDKTSPSAAFIPSLQGWQTSLYTGGVSYQYPLDVPTGPAGIKPNLTLSYSSTSTDGATGTRGKQQSSWVGKGWSLDTGYIALNRLAGESSASHYYSMVLNGQSFDLVRGELRAGGSADAGDPTQWEWHPTDESFIRARAESNGVSDGTRGGYDNHGAAYPRYTWQVWTKDGTRYEFSDDAWQGFQTCDFDNKAFMETYKWYLTRVVDTHRNLLTYSYEHTTEQSVSCQNVHGTIDYAVRPTQISWGANATTGALDRYRVVFSSTVRTIDTLPDGSANQMGKPPTEKWRLNAVQVMSNQTADANTNGWELVRQYNLGYATNSANYLHSDVSVSTGPSGCEPQACNYVGDTTTSKLTLTSIQRVGNGVGGTSGLPPTTFTYGLAQGGSYYPAGDWNRLTTVNNGQGGTITFVYENIGNYLENVANPRQDHNTSARFRNNRRVVAKTVADGRGNPYTWTYDYTHSNPEYNSLGTALLDKGPNTYPNSAVLYLNQKWSSTGDDWTGYLVHKEDTEFRGHKEVIERDPNDNETEHWFMQGDLRPEEVGDTVCTPTAQHEDINSYNTDSCFVQLRNREALKGREYKTVTYQGHVDGATKLSEVRHNLASNFIEYGSPAITGLWRAFNVETQTVETAWDSGSTALNKYTAYTYDSSATGYGNLTQVQESDDSSILRKTLYNYASYVTNVAGATNNSYIVDRRRVERVLDASNNMLARTVYGYDGSNGPAALSFKGELTLVRKYYDIPVPLTIPTLLHSSDTSYGYDAFGNQTTVTTYAGAGTGMSSDASYSAPGASSTARPITTTYDTLFNTLPVKYEQTAVNGVTLTQQANYDYRMGTMTSVVDANGFTTSAEYDSFGRMVKLIKPGDSSAFPTLQSIYYDTAQPFKYMALVREVSASSPAIRPIMRFYDGLGREIQTKSESVNGLQNIITDKMYDGMGQVIRQSQPRYINNNSANISAFYGYITPIASLYRPTITTYDGLGRPLTVTAPDSSVTTMVYLIGLGRRLAVTTDAKNHRNRTESDMFGRLMTVREYSGETSPWPVYSSTYYEYSPLDLLTRVTDSMGKQTTMSYDSLGRKTSMIDPTMGTWSYAYDVNGNLTSQTDNQTPTRKTTTFQYDALNRLISKTPADNTTSTFTYDQTGTTYGSGKGQRTSMKRVDSLGATVSQTQWQYDSRGQTTQAIYSLMSGLAGSYTYNYSYDSGGRMTSMTYPSGEVVQYTYDAAWRQTKAHSTTYNVDYASNATYTALDQPITTTLGSGLTPSYTYNNVMARLDGFRVGTAVDKAYAYDVVGNVSTIDNNLIPDSQTFLYDHRDRLINWKINAVTQENYTYDLVGNITNKGSTAYTYTYNPPAGTGGGPYAVRSTTTNGVTQNITYDGNGNMTNSGGRTLIWSADNQPIQANNWPVSEDYAYDADGERVKRSNNNTNVDTFYIGGLFEQDAPSNTTRTMYQFNGQVIAQRTVSGASNTLIYLHSDHLGSVSAATSVTGAVLSQQNFDPWGKVRPGGMVSQTKLNYTGQKLDDTGLLYYHARYYDPSLARFTSPDSIVPGMQDGKGGMASSVGEEQNSKLTVDFHESGFLSSAKRENTLILKQGFWSKNRNIAGPDNPQALNRYTYVLNNPLRYTDPNGHLCAGPGKCLDPITAGRLLFCAIFGCDPPFYKAPATLSNAFQALSQGWDKFWKEVSDKAHYLQYISFITEVVQEELAGEAWTQYGSNTDDWEYVKTEGSDPLKNPSRQGDTRLYVIFKDMKTGKYYRVSVDVSTKEGGGVYDVHLSSNQPGSGYRP